MHDERSVARNHASDLDYLHELELRVDSRLRGLVQFFRLMQEPRGLVLRGLARSYYAKQLAQHAVMEATPLRIAANEIEVCSARSNPSP